jgi:hypothetical protein
LVGKTVAIAGEHLTGAQMAEKLSKGMGINVSYNAVSPEAYRGFGFPALKISATCSSSTRTSKIISSARAMWTTLVPESEVAQLRAVAGEEQEQTCRLGIDGRAPGSMAGAFLLVYLMDWTWDI